MASNKVSFALTLDNILARMKPGTKYTAYQLAAKFKVPTDDVRPKVLELIKNGSVRLEPSARNNYYIKPANDGQIDAQPAKVEEPIVIANGDFEVAAPLLPVDMTSNLKGYDAEFNRFRNLCMGIRRTA